ncbi:uromodulin-like isoform X2 [Lithobates pipiens]
MRGQRSLPFFLVLLYASSGRTQLTTSLNPSTQGYNCTQREGTSITVLMDYVVSYRGDIYFKEVLNPVSARFPCVKRQYTAITLNNAETNEIITNDKSDFLKTLTRNSVNYFHHQSECNQSFFYGLKRALEISPADSIILVYSSGSFADLEYIKTEEYNYVYSLLEQKMPQIYILSYAAWYCNEGGSDYIFNTIPSLSYGGFFDMTYVMYSKFLWSLKYLLSKPLNSSVRILNLNIDVTEEYTAVFNVTASLSYLLIRRNEKLALNLTDPNGNSYTFRKFPYHISSNYHIPRSHLVKSPAAGSWILNAQGNSILSVQILGFTGLNKSGNCSDSDCHPNATCSEFGGYGECTCKEGFTGDGKSCNDIDECQDYNTNNCIYWYNKCVNTIGSYTCDCSTGLKYDAEFGCVDIDECADSSLNDCDPVAKCTNYEHQYGCTCPNGYYGDGRHCEVNECQQGTPCGSGAECFKDRIGSYSCIDPCSSHTVLNDPWRSTFNTYAYDMYGYSKHSDYALSGWYRFEGEYDQQIPEYCVPRYSCGADTPIWMNGSHPTVNDGIVNRTACPNWNDGCCTQPYNISVKMCPGGYYVYNLQSTPIWNSAYCTESNSSCLGVSCAQGEECRILDSVPGCYCKNSSYTTDGMQPESLLDDLTPQVTCGLEKIEVRFGKCLLEKLGYNTSSLHLRDYSCRGITERRDKRYITFITPPKNGECGAIARNNGTVILYTNTVYLTPNSDKGENRDAYSIDFRCFYPSGVEINLPTAVGADVAAKFCYSSAPINVAGTANFSIKMDLFQDSGYTTPYNSSQVWLNSSSMLYVGVIVTGATDSSKFVLLMKNCYATPTADGSSGPRYEIITDHGVLQQDLLWKAKII